ncbi:MAG: histone deacetylase family protein [Rhodospirillaceae bacterium]|nr:MAG: histone deacetylase family protein [Rhodospirillaceae bacterium]
MTTLLVTHASATGHDTGDGHPEQPDRIRHVLKALEQPVFAQLQRVAARTATLDQMARAHPRAFVEAVLRAVPEQGFRSIDADTILSPGSGAAIADAAGAVITAVDAVAGGTAANAFCAVRPPGHHAESTRAMGFCLVNNVAIGALHARAAYGYRRIAVVDFDVHHGNGTQDIFWNDPEAFYASTHQFPNYPGTGARREQGAHANVVNVPIRPGGGGDPFRAGFMDEILPALTVFKPDFILVSAGFDAHKDDPLADLHLTETDFAWATASLVKASRELCGGRLVSVLEGGYNLDALAESVVAHVQTLQEAGHEAGA